MTRFTHRAGLTVLLGLALVGSRRDAPAAARAVFPYPIQKTVLDNGLTVLSVPFDSPGIIAYYTIVRTGSRTRSRRAFRDSPISSST